VGGYTSPVATPLVLDASDAMRKCCRRLMCSGCGLLHVCHLCLSYGCTGSDYFKAVQSRGSGFGENLFWDHRTKACDETIGVNKLTTMLSAAVNRQYSSYVLPLLGHCLPVFEEKKDCGTAILYFFIARVNNTN